MIRKIARKCDMGSGMKLQLLIEDDGDVIISVMKTTDRVAMEHVEFCISGTQSPNTTMALHQLYDAMQLDEEGRAQKI